MNPRNTNEPQNNRFQRCARTTARTVVAVVILLLASYAATILQYTAQYEPGTKAAYALREAMIGLDMPEGRLYRYPQSHLEQLKDLQEKYDSAWLPDGTARPEYREL